MVKPIYLSLLCKHLRIIKKVRSILSISLTRCKVVISVKPTVIRQCNYILIVAKSIRYITNLVFILYKCYFEKVFLFNAFLRDLK